MDEVGLPGWPTRMVVKCYEAHLDSLTFVVFELLSSVPLPFLLQQLWRTLIRHAV